MVLLLLALLATHGVSETAVLVLPVLHALQPVVTHRSDDSSGSGELALLLAGPVSGTALYAAVHRYYRNADKTHHFETETLIALKDEISGQEKKVDEVRGTRERRIRGDNSADFRRRVSKLE